MRDWVDAFYDRLDGGDPGWSDLCADTIRVQMANMPATTGRDVMIAGPLGQIRGLVKTISHSPVSRMDISPDKSVLEAVVSYTLADDAVVSVQAATIISRNADGLIDDLRIYCDPTPLLSRFQGA